MYLRYIRWGRRRYCIKLEFIEFPYILLRKSWQHATQVDANLFF